MEPINIHFEDVPGPGGLRRLSSVTGPVTVSQMNNIVARLDESNKARLVRYDVALCICCGGPAHETEMH